MTSPHATLLVWCARQLATGQAGEPPLAGMDQGEWSSFLRTTVDHFCLPVAWRALEPWSSSMPADVASDLRAGFDANSVRNLRLAGELVQLIRTLDHAGVRAVPWKGPLLAERGYGDLRLRQFFDLDLLVQRADLLRARDALQAAGYRVSLPMTDRQLTAYVDHMGELELERESDGLWVELHTAIVPSYFSSGRPSDDLWSRLVSVRVARATLSALDPVDDIEALAIHGSKHRWERLSWILDVAMTSRAMDDDAWRKLIAAARDHGTLRMVAIALLAAEAVCGTPVAAAIAPTVRGDGVARRLSQEVQDTLFAIDTGRRAELMFHVRMRERAMDQIRYLLNVVYTPSANDWQSFALPRALFPLYLLTRPLRLVATFGRRAIVGDR
jgi:hypothetical protein